MAAFLIPLVNVPQQFDITLNQTDYNLTCKWNDSVGGGWVFDIIDSQTSVPLVCNIPLVCGADLLEQYEYLGFNAQLIVYTDGDDTAVPTLENLGIESNVYYLTSVV